MVYLARRVLTFTCTPLLVSISLEALAQQNDDAIQETKVETNLKTRRTELREIDRNQQSGTGYGLFGSLDLGIFFTTPSNQLYKQLEASQLGAAPAVKIIGTVFTRRIALDLGLGLQYASYSGERIGYVGFIDGEVTAIPIKEKYSRTQLAMLVDAAARLRFKQKFHVGILATALYSAKSAGYTALPLDEDPSLEPYLVFLGPQFIYETPMNRYVSRIGASFSVSLTGEYRTSFLGTLNASIGSHLNNTSTIIKTKTETNVKTRTVKEVISLKAETAEMTDNVSFVFDSQMVKFKLNSAELSDSSKEFLEELAGAFLSEKDIWEKLTIEGHTDSRGSAAYNQRLSQLRARSVAAELMKAGISSDALATLGLGSQRPIAKNEQSEVDYARNRRVEIKVNGLKDARKLKRAVEEVQRKFFGGRAPTPPPPLREPTLDSNPPGESTPSPEPVFDPGIVPTELE